MSSSYTLDFKKLESQGISKAKTIDYLRNNTQSNVDFDSLESFFKESGYTQEQTIDAIYNEVSNFKDLQIMPKKVLKAPMQTNLGLNTQTSPTLDSEKAPARDDLAGSETTKSEDNTSAPRRASGGEAGFTPARQDLAGSETTKSEDKMSAPRRASGDTLGFAQSVKTSRGAEATKSEAMIQGRTSGDVLDDMQELGFTSTLDTLKSGATLGFYVPESERKRKEALKELGKEAKDKGLEFESLPANYKQLLAQEYDEENSFFKGSGLNFNAFNIFKSEDDKAKEVLERQKQREIIAQIKDVKELSQEQRNLIADDEGFLNNAWDYLFSDEKETLKNYQEKLKSKEITKDAQKALEFLNNIHSSKSVKSALFGASEEEKEQYLQEVLKIGDVLGFDDVGQDSKGHIYFFKGEEAYKINEGFFDNFTNILEANIGSMGLGLAGAAQGAKLGKDLRSKAVGAVIGGAVGSFAGGSADYLIANAYLNRENNFNEMISHATQEGVLSIAGDFAAIGIAKGVKSIAKKYKDGSLGESVGKIIDYTPIVGFAKRAIDGNAKAAQSLINTTYTQEQQKAIQNFAFAFGGEILPSKEGSNALAKSIQSSFGTDSKAYKAFDALHHALTLPNHTERQLAYIQAIRADDSGALIAFLSEAAASSPKANDNLKRILNATTHKLAQNLESLNLNKGDIKAIFDELESGTKGSYDEAINGVLSQIYDDTYKVVLDRSKAVEGAKAQSKSTLQADLNTQEIQEAIAKWDLSNPKSSDKLIISKVDDTELELLSKEFDFKGNYAIAREIDAQHIAHALNRHQADLNAANIPLSKDEIFTHYPNITRDYDHRVVTTNNTIIYAKQVNGHFIAIEEVLTGKNKLRFDTAWKQKGELNKEVLFKNARVFPNTIKSHKVASDERNLDQILGGTSHNQNPSKSHSTTKRQSYNAFRKELEEQGLLDENGLKFLNFVEKNIYDPKGVSFTQLNNALKMINSYYKEATDPNLKSHIKNAVENFLREDIKEGIEQILAQNKSAYKDAKSLYETALQDYANMKGTLKLVDKIKLRDIKTTQDKAIESLLNLAKGQGDRLDNISAITKALSAENRAVMEVNMLQAMFHKALYDKESLKVFDSGAFFKELESLNKETFQSKAAQDFIELAKGFDKLFKNDVLIAKSLSPTTTKAIGSSIATTLEGAIKFQLVREMFSHIIRLMPYIPFAKGLNEKVSGAALRFHIKNALAKSYSVSDFKSNLKQKVAKAHFDNDTKAYLRAMSESVEKVQDSVIESASNAHIKASNAKDLQEYNTLQKYDVSSLHLLTKQEYESFVDSVLSGEVESLKAAPNIVHIANLSQEISQELGLNNAKVFLRKNDLHHFRSERKGAYNQDMPKEVIKALPQIIESATEAYIDKVHKNFFITRELNEKEVVKISINKDDMGNFIITSSRIEKRNLSQSSVKVGDAPTTPYRPESRNLSDKPITNNHGVNTDEVPNDSTKSQKIQATQESLIEKAMREKSELLAQKEAALREKEAKAKALAKEAQEAREAIIKEKEALSGLRENERILVKGEDIALKRVPHLKSSVSLDDESIYPLDFVIVKASDIKPQFEATGTQTRTQSNENIIEQIAKEFNPSLIFNRGGFDDVPIILSDGKVISGNHRAQGMKGFTQESRQRYTEAVKEAYNVELKDDELLMRMPQDSNMSMKEIINLAAASNKERLSNIGDKVISSLGRFDKHLQNLGKIESDSVDELAQSVARKLDKNALSPEIEAPNLALLAHNARNSDDNSLSNVLNTLSKELDISDFNALKDMYVKTAGEWHNLMQNAELAHLTIAPYLLNAIKASGDGLGRTRAYNFSSSLEKINYVLNSTDSKGANALLNQKPKYYDELISELLGYSLSRFARLENPAANLYEFLKGVRDGLENQVSPSLFSEGKPLKEADIYDFVELAIKSGESSEATSKVVDMLPALREKHRAFENSSALSTQKESYKPNLPTLQDNSTSKLYKMQDTESATKTMKAFTDSKGITHNIPQEIKNIIDSSPQKGRDMAIIGSENFTPEVVKYAQETNKKVAIEKLGKEEAEKLGYRYPDDVRVTIDSSAINHTLNRHGKDSNLVKQSGQKAVDYEDIAQYRSIVKTADETLNSVDNMGTPVIVSYKQINGHFIVVEELRKGQNELNFKTMFKQEGNYKDSQSYKETSQSSNATEGYEPTANSFALAKDNSTTKPQTSLFDSANTQAKQDLETSTSQEVKSFKYAPIENSQEVKELKEQLQTKIQELKEIEQEAQRKYLEKDLELNARWYKTHNIDEMLEQIMPRKMEELEKGFNVADFQAYNKYDFIKKYDEAKELREAIKYAKIPAEVKEYYKNVDKHYLSEAYHSMAFERGKASIDEMLSRYAEIKADKLREYLEVSSGADMFATKTISDNEILQHKMIKQTLSALEKQKLTTKKALQEALKNQRGKIESINGMKPLVEFGTNYAEHYHSPKSAINKLLIEKQGQVSGAFHKEGLGDIDLVWGDSKMGLAHILEKHKEDFTAFGNDKEGVINGLSEIVENGVIISKNGVDTIYLERDGKYYTLGLSKGWHNKGNNNWVITSYEAKNLKDDLKVEIGSANKTFSADDSLNERQTFNSTAKQDSTTTSQTSLFDSANTQAKQGLESSLAHKPKDTEATKSYFNESSPNIMHSNAYIGSGLLSGGVAGIETDENGNITGFNPQKFALGFLGGAVGGKAVSSGYKIAKVRYYEKHFDRFIDDVNAKKSQMQPRFQVTQELEKSYRENELKLKNNVAETLGIKGKVFADYVKLAQKHPEYFANPQEAKALTEYIAQNAKTAIKASKKEYELVFAELQGGKGVFAIDLEYKGGKHRIRSVYLMKNSQYKKKLYEAKKLGEPILQF